MIAPAGFGILPNSNGIARASASGSRAAGAQLTLAGWGQGGSYITDKVVMIGLQVSVLLHDLPMVQRCRFGEPGSSWRARLLGSQILRQQQNCAEMNSPRKPRLQIYHSLISAWRPRRPFAQGIHYPIHKRGQRRGLLDIRINVRIHRSAIGFSFASTQLWHTRWGSPTYPAALLSPRAQHWPLSSLGLR